jgi:Asp-tRNA(Asn)/Glu-tRNA(Gln) amidotransferase B subunit
LPASWPLAAAPEWLASIRARLPELPAARRNRYVADLGLSAYDAAVIVNDFAATALFAFLVAWKEYLFALALTSEDSMYLLTVGIANLFGESRVAWNEVMAAAMVATVPALVFYIFLERHMVRGLTAGAVKG